MNLLHDLPVYIYLVWIALSRVKVPTVGLDFNSEALPSEPRNFNSPEDGLKDNARVAASTFRNFIHSEASSQGSEIPR